MRLHHPRELSAYEESRRLTELVAEDDALQEAQQRRDREKETESVEWWGKPNG